MGIALAQDKVLTIDKRQPSLKASSNADQYRWYIDGVEQSGQSTAVFVHNWIAGKYELSVVPILNGCSGDPYIVDLTVKDDASEGDTQVVIISPSPVIACAATDAVPDASVIPIEVELLKYVLAPDEEYVITYVIGSAMPVTRALNSAKAVFNVDTKDLAPGNHTLRISTLAFGQGFKNQINYNFDETPPSIIIQVKPKLEIEEIGFEE